MSMEIIQSAATELLVNVALAVLALARMARPSDYNPKE